MSEFSIMVITRNRCELLKQTLPPLLRFASNNFGEVIVVNDNSTDETENYLELENDKYECLTPIKHEKNLGIGPARNSGLKKSTGNVILCLDDDIMIEDETLKNAILSFDKFPTAGVVAPSVIERDNGQPRNGVPYLDENNNKPVANNHGAFGIIRREALLKAGYYDENITYGADERSFTMKIHIAGFDIIFDPSIVGYHIDTVDRSKPNLFRLKMWTFHTTRLNFKYLPFFYATLFSLRYTVTMIFSGRKLFPIGSVILIVSFFKGAITGIKKHEKMPPRSIKYFTSSKLYPNYGNNSLIKRLVDKYRGNKIY